MNSFFAQNKENEINIDMKAQNQKLVQSFSFLQITINLKKKLVQKCFKKRSIQKKRYPTKTIVRKKIKYQNRNSK